MSTEPTVHEKTQEASGELDPPIAAATCRPAGERRGTRMPWLVAMVVAAVWLVVTIVIGILTMAQTTPPTPALPGLPQDLTPSSYRSAYGGDAYTGIQNAAADTENAVIEAANAQRAADAALANWSAQYEGKLAEAQLQPLARGVGFLLIGTGIAPFVVTLAAYPRRGTQWSSAPRSHDDSQDPERR